MQILEHEHRRGPPVELPHDLIGDRVGFGSGSHERLEVTAAMLGDLDERAERTWGPQRRAGAPEHAGLALLVLAEASQQRGLAHTRLAADEHEPADPACVGEQIRQCGQRRLSLEQRSRGAGGRVNAHRIASPDLVPGDPRSS